MIFKVSRIAIAVYLQSCVLGKMIWFSVVQFKSCLTLNHYKLLCVFVTLTFRATADDYLCNRLIVLPWRRCENVINQTIEVCTVSHYCLSLIGGSLKKQKDEEIWNEITVTSPEKLLQLFIVTLMTGSAKEPWIPSRVNKSTLQSDYERTETFTD